jgi:hypothetical protein
MKVTHRTGRGSLHRLVRYFDWKAFADLDKSGVKDVPNEEEDKHATKISKCLSPEASFMCVANHDVNVRGNTDGKHE